MEIFIVFILLSIFLAIIIRAIIKTEKGKVKKEKIEIKAGIYTAPPSKADNLLKEATAAKQNGDINKAIELLKEAYKEIKKSGVIYSVNTYLRLPLYLQEAGRKDEAWKEFNELILSSFSNSEVAPMDHSIIYDKMRLFLQREGKHKKAVRFGLFSYFSWAIGLYRQERKEELEGYLSENNYKKKIDGVLKKADLLELRESFYHIIEEEKEKLPNINLSELAKKIDNICK